MVNVVKGGGRAPPTVTNLSQFFHHNGMYAKKRPLPLCVYSESQTLPWWLGGRRGKDDRKQNTFGPVGTVGRRVSPALPNLLFSNSFNIQAVVLTITLLY